MLFNPMPAAIVRWYAMKKAGGRVSSRYNVIRGGNMGCVPEWE